MVRAGFGFCFGREAARAVGVFFDREARSHAASPPPRRAAGAAAAPAARHPQDAAPPRRRRAGGGPGLGLRHAARQRGARAHADRPLRLRQPRLLHEPVGRAAADLRALPGPPRPLGAPPRPQARPPLRPLCRRAYCPAAPHPFRCPYCPAVPALPLALLSRCAGPAVHRLCPPPLQPAATVRRRCPLSPLFRCLPASRCLTPPSAPTVRSLCPLPLSAPSAPSLRLSPAPHCLPRSLSLTAPSALCFTLTFLLCAPPAKRLCSYVSLGRIDWSEETKLAISAGGEARRRPLPI